MGKSITTIPREVMAALVEYSWPGNVRELENVIERAMILAPGSALVLEGSFHVASSRQREVRLGGRERAERTHVVQVLEDCNWKIKGAGNAADRLGLQPSTLRYRMKIMGIQRPNSPRAG